MTTIPQRSEHHRDEVIAFITGEGNYLSDIVDKETDVLHAFFVRSNSAHARIVDIDTSDARSMPGVEVFCAEDLGRLIVPGQLRPNMVAVDGMDRSVLADNVVRYVGEPVVLIVACNLVDAVDASETISIQYEDLPVVVDPVEAIADEVVLFTDAGTNVVEHRQVGSTPGTLREDEVEVLVESTNPRVAAVPLETLGVLAIPEANSLTVICGHQLPHGLKRDLARILGMPPEAIRVVVPDVGGAFGLKGPLYVEYAACARAALALGRKIAWREQRREHFLGGTHGRSQHHKIRLRGDLSGQIRSLEVEILADLGAYPSAGSFIPGTTFSMAQGPYHIPEVQISMISAVTNTAPIGPYRGAGRPEATYALEMAIEQYATAIEMDPVEVRRLNLIHKTDLPYETATGARYEGGDYRGALEELVRLMDLPAIRAQQQEPDARYRLGAGLCMFVEPAGGASGLGEYARASLNEDGTVSVFCGSIGSGQGHAAIIRRLVHDCLAIPAAMVLVHAGDTLTVPRGIGTFGSRSVQTGLVAVLRAIREVESRCRWAASGLLAVEISDLETTRLGMRARDNPDLFVEYGDISAFLKDQGKPADVEEWYEPGAETYPYGAYGAVVWVDMETGATTVDRIVAVDDCGVVLDKPGAAGQIVGGAAQGFGQAMNELIQYDGNGQLLTASMTDYLIPSAVRVPSFVISGRQSVTGVNELGVRGIGEAGAIGVPPAIALAIKDAVGSVPNMPFTPESVWRAARPAHCSVFRSSGA